MNSGELSPRYVTITCLTHGDGIVGRGRWEVEAQKGGGGGGVGGAKHLGDRIVQTFLIHKLAQR